MEKYHSFTFQEKILSVNFIETVSVKEGTQCDVYEFVGDKEKDLGIIQIDAGGSIPKSKVLKGDKTVEGYISGKGYLILEKITGEIQKFQVEEGIPFEIEIEVGESVQWVADQNSELIAYEICYPPYQDGRYEYL